MEQVGIVCIMLLKAVKTNFVNQQYVRGKITFQFFLQCVIGQTCQEFPEHISRGGITTGVGFSATDKQQGLGKMTLAGSGITGKNQPLFALHKIKTGKIHDLSLVQPLLKRKVKICK